jgi:phosphatidylglycerophosphate synthase
MRKLERKSVIKYSDFISNYFYQQIAFFLTKYIYKTNVTPNQITLLSLFMGLLSALFIYKNHTVLGVIFLNISFILDCLDGQIARVKNMQSDFGMWLDNISDRIVENVVVIAIIFGNFTSNIIYGGVILLFLNML